MSPETVAAVIDLGQLAKRESGTAKYEGFEIGTSAGYNRRILAEKILLELVRSGIRYEDESAQSMAKDAVELAEAFLKEIGQ